MAALNPPAALWAPLAWLPGGGWHRDVLLRIGSDGCWAEVRVGAPSAAAEGATPLGGPVLPGMVDAHSHAFQRAFAGLAERRDGAHDDFWSWRERMYGIASRVSPEQLHAIACQLYAELLQGGYTQVCEFHYLHHAPDGQPYADPLTMSRALAQAALDTGIGLTLLPTLYERAGFDATGVGPGQQRFAAGVDRVLALRDGVRALRMPRVGAGVAIHSLRAAAPESIRRLVDALAGDDAPIHIHVAEQLAEVDDCIAATGRRPIEWLADEIGLDARWQLVHATHALPRELDAVARAGAGVVICPSTEADLGDGLADLPGWLAREASMAIGSDSQVCRHWPHELRLLEWGQRLALRRRNIAAAPERGQDSTAARLFDRLLAGGAAAAGFDTWGLVPGARADLIVLDPDAAGLRGVPSGHLLDALVFATDVPAISEVWVAGRRAVAQGQALDAGAIGARYVAATGSLHA